jgi:Rrf2 family iron-sulfur cluster assembly transcriptional regulator
MRIMNFRFSRRTYLAMRALRELLHEQGQLAGGVLADRIGTTSPFLPQVLGPLVKAGWVESQPGPGGGYRLAVSLADVSLLEVVETVEGPTETGECVLRDGPCPGTESCAVHEAWLSARTELKERLQAVSAETTFERKAS